MKANLHTLLYATVLGGTCALLLTGASQSLAPYREANQRADEVRNILEVLGVGYDREATAKELVDVFDREVRMERRGELTVYRHVSGEDGEDGETVAVAFAGSGLWGPIKGFLAMDGAMKKIRGITFHEQEETPGLGGDIGSDWFRARFQGKLIEGPDGTAGIRIRRPGEAPGPNKVEAITGATMTCERVETMLNALIGRIVRERQKDG
jgi:Na+-transporting NADH:ubiquinone oxidoreductase subunit C